MTQNNITRNRLQKSKQVLDAEKALDWTEKENQKHGERLCCIYKYKYSAEKVNAHNRFQVGLLLQFVLYNYGHMGRAFLTYNY